ncbi:YbhB/YbcL family Raf kinase inhibitor-like protein [Gryllotalpicola protaetiae]|uniref:YbhB/YbcL family Raf kinase inhibitor-like protein n=1 Tax=Gryllotalpicola protaetiae TaxID=2419771 RepID=A0A387BLG9_9MICO|nr:YbhB/YbcL family Raf kinase inhibitor-like protein [Gryllotalpicola protaetiae]AYG03498.1 YbhB/YbcL family Raf kinase inhibitor-like protein [Gryllotalpicola protaetiae]
MPGLSTRLGRALRNRRAGERRLAWFRPEFAGPETIVLTSPAFGHLEHMPESTAGRGVGGDVSPALAWTGVPAGAASLTLIVQDHDVPLPVAITHARVAEIAPETTAIAQGGIRGWHGPRPIPGHGPHHYVFQLFALDGSGRVVARGRLDGVYERD